MAALPPVAGEFGGRFAPPFGIIVVAGGGYRWVRGLWSILVALSY